MSEALGVNRATREAGDHARQRAQDWAGRAARAERGPEPLTCPPGANAAQRAAWHGAMGEIVAREQQSKVARGWQRLATRSAPFGCIPLCALDGQRMVVLVVDRAGRLRVAEGTKAGAVVTVSEAVADARG